MLHALSRPARHTFQPGCANRALQPGGEVEALAGRLPAPRPSERAVEQRLHEGRVVRRRARCTTARQPARDDAHRLALPGRERRAHRREGVGRVAAVRGMDAWRSANGDTSSARARHQLDASTAAGSASPSSASDAASSAASAARSQRVQRKVEPRAVGEPGPLGQGRAAPRSSRATRRPTRPGRRGAADGRARTRARGARSRLRRASPAPSDTPRPARARPARRRWRGRRPGRAARARRVSRSAGSVAARRRPARQAAAAGAALRARSRQHLASAMRCACAASPSSTSSAGTSVSHSISVGTAPRRAMRVAVELPHGRPHAAAVVVDDDVAAVSQ